MQREDSSAAVVVVMKRVGPMGWTLALPGKLSRLAPCGQWHVAPGRAIALRPNGTPAPWAVLSVSGQSLAPPLSTPFRHGWMSQARRQTTRSRRLHPTECDMQVMDCLPLCAPIPAPVSRGGYIAIAQSKPARDRLPSSCRDHPLAVCRETLREEKKTTLVDSVCRTVVA